MSVGPDANAGGRFGRFEVRPAERRLHVDGQPVALGSRAFDLLAALVARRDRIVPKDELIEVVWPGLVVEDNNLQVQISALRKVLGTSAIATVPGRGYQFTVAVSAAGAPPAAPVATEPAAAPVPPRERHDADAPRRSRLLVADDNKVNRLLLCRSLELMGHDVSRADNGRVALEMLRAERYDLLLLDLEMPELDGFGLLAQRALEPALREVPVIVTSSLEGAAPVARCIELGADDFLHKPVNPVLLKARVDASLERRHLRAQLARLSARSAAAGIAVSAGAGRRVEATLLSARLHDFDTLASRQPAQETLDLLGSWATLMLDAVEGQGGEMHGSSADGLAAVYEQADADADPADAGGADATWRAAQAALEMSELVAQFNAERAMLGKPEVVLGVGLARGSVVIGRAGPAYRAAQVCVGVAVERAARLSELAGRRGAGSVLVDATSKVALGGRTASAPVAPVVLPGSSRAVPVHALQVAGSAGS